MIDDKAGLIGHFMMTIKNDLGEILDVVQENNIVVNLGKEYLLKAMNTPNTTDYIFKTIKIGNDVGTGTLLVPEQPTVDYTKDNQDVVYEINPANIVISYPEPKKVNYFTTINGATVMQNYPLVPNIVYTSATIVNGIDGVIAYKRFPARTISALISVDISWTLEII